MIHNNAHGMSSQPTNGIQVSLPMLDITRANFREYDDAVINTLAPSTGKAGRQLYGRFQTYVKRINVLPTPNDFVFSSQTGIGSPVIFWKVRSESDLTVITHWDLKTRFFCQSLFKLRAPTFFWNFQFSKISSWTFTKLFKIICELIMNKTYLNSCTISKL